MNLSLFMVMSIDGVVAFDEQTDIRAYSSAEDHAFFMNGAASCDAAIMGRYSYNRDVACKRKYLLTHASSLPDIGADTTILSGEAKELYQRIENDGNKKVALLGGPRTNAAFLSEGYVDELYLTIEPVILGKGIRFAADALTSRWSLNNTIQLNKNGTVVLHYLPKKKDTSDKQNRWNKILHNDRFQMILKELEIAEKDRRFCRHNIAHLLDTARIMQIINLEEGHCLSKDLIYAAGLLHDIGRLCQYKDGTPHEKAAVPIAEEILTECGYCQEERITILCAISAHRRTEYTGIQEQQLSNILFRADKAGRLCFQCGVQDECNWPEEKKNTEMFY